MKIQGVYCEHYTNPILSTNELREAASETSDDCLLLFPNASAMFNFVNHRDVSTPQLKAALKQKYDNSIIISTSFLDGFKDDKDIIDRVKKHSRFILVDFFRHTPQIISRLIRLVNVPMLGIVIEPEDIFLEKQAWNDIYRLLISEKWRSDQIEVFIHLRYNISSGSELLRTIMFIATHLSNPVIDCSISNATYKDIVTKWEKS